MSQEQAPSKYLKLDRSVVTKQIIHCTGQNPSHTNDGAQTEGFTVTNYGQRAVVIRWVGPVDNETKNLNRYEQALQRSGYRVRRMTEDNVEPHSKAQKEQQRKRRNRELLIAQKLKPEHQPQKRQRQRSRGGVHVR